MKVPWRGHKGQGSQESLAGRGRQKPGSQERVSVLPGLLGEGDFGWRRRSGHGLQVRAVGRGHSGQL